jgi:hypothetical protein
MKQDEIVRFWGLQNLRRWMATDIANAAIPESAKTFLVDVGMPVQEGWTLRFDPEADILPRLSPHSSYRRFGFDDAVRLCLDEARGGAVIAVDIVDAVAPVGGQWYVNRDVVRFGACLVYYEQYRAAALETSEVEIEGVISATERLIRVEDPTAFEDANSWWPSIIQQMSHGLL